MSLSNRRAMVAILNHRDRQAAGKRGNVTRRLNRAKRLLQEAVNMRADPGINLQKYSQAKDRWFKKVKAFLKGVK